MTQKACVRREGRRPRGEANHAERMDSFHGQGRHVGLRSAPRVEPTRPASLRRVVYAWPSCTTVCSSSNYAPQREWRKQREAPADLQNFQRYKFVYIILGQQRTTPPPARNGLQHCLWAVTLSLGWTTTCVMVRGGAAGPGGPRRRVRRSSAPQLQGPRRASLSLSAE